MCDMNKRFSQMAVEMVFQLNWVEAWTQKQYILISRLNKRIVW